MEYKLRQATESDFANILNLFKEFATFEKVPEKMVNSVDRMMKEKDLFNCFVAETKDKNIIGYVTYFFTYHTWIGKCLYMDDLYVVDAYRHKGIGKKLLETVIDIAKTQGCHKLRWQVSNWNKNAQEFYKSMGAEIDGVELNCDLKVD